MLVLNLVGALALSLAVALLFVPLVHRLAVRMGWMDRPDGHRKVHVRVVPRVGGLAIVGAMGIGLGCFGLIGSLLASDQAVAFEIPSVVLLIGALLMAGVGFVDDVRDMPALPKLIAQILVSALVVAGGLRITVFDGALGGGDFALAVSMVLTIIWIVGVVNGVNFIDGMDGLAGGVVAIALIGLGTVHAIGGDVSGIFLVAVALGAVLGFLYYNVRPASIFMGDVGSHFLGFVLAVLALRGTAHENPTISLTIAAVVLGLPILDMLITIIRRPQYDKPLLHSDGDHFHHRLMVRFPDERVVGILYLASGFFAGGAVLMALSSAQAAVLIFCLGVVVVSVFLYWLGYLPGRFSTGPADGRGATRSLYRIVVDPARLSRGDGAVQPVELKLAMRSEESSNASIEAVAEETAAQPAASDDG